MTLEAISKKTNLSVHRLEDIIITDHVYGKLFPKSKLRTIKVNINGDNLKFVNEVAKLLKVDASSVIVSAVLEALKQEEMKKQYQKYDTELAKRKDDDA